MGEVAAAGQVKAHDAVMGGEQRGVHGKVGGAACVGRGMTIGHSSGFKSGGREIVKSIPMKVLVENVNRREIQGDDDEQNSSYGSTVFFFLSWHYDLPISTTRPFRPPMTPTCHCRAGH